MHCQGPKWEHVPFDPDACEVLVMNTKKPRELAASGFNERVAECAAAHRYLCEHVRERPNPGRVLGGPISSRARGAWIPCCSVARAHVITEMARIAAGAAALRNHDYAALGAQLDKSHASTATDYAVSCGRARRDHRCRARNAMPCSVPV